MNSPEQVEVVSCVSDTGNGNRWTTEFDRPLILRKTSRVALRSLSVGIPTQATIPPGGSEFQFRYTNAAPFATVTIPEGSYSPQELKNAVGTALNSAEIPLLPANLNYGISHSVKLVLGNGVPVRYLIDTYVNSPFNVVAGPGSNNAAISAQGTIARTDGGGGDWTAYIISNQRGSRGANFVSLSHNGEAGAVGYISGTIPQGSPAPEDIVLATGGITVEWTAVGDPYSLWRYDRDTGTVISEPSHTVCNAGDVVTIRTNGPFVSVDIQPNGGPRQEELRVRRDAIDPHGRITWTPALVFWVYAAGSQITAAQHTHDINAAPWAPPLEGVEPGDLEPIGDPLGLVGRGIPSTRTFNFNDVLLRSYLGMNELMTADGNTATTRLTGPQRLRGASLPELQVFCESLPIKTRDGFSRRTLPILGVALRPESEGDSLVWEAKELLFHSLHVMGELAINELVLDLKTPSGERVETQGRSLAVLEFRH